MDTNGASRPDASDRVMNPKQLGLINNLSWELGLDVDYALRSHNEGTLEGLTYNKASDIIDELKRKVLSERRAYGNERKYSSILTPKQLGRIQNDCEKKGLNMTETIKQHNQNYGTGEYELPEMNMQWASAFIDYLKGL